MPRPWRTLRIFVSSTFRDMHSERDYLVRVVFPELRERCAKLLLHLVDVDLRWGVTEEEAEQGRVLEICLDEIERCRPFFLGILGERYGSILPAQFTGDQNRYQSLRELGEGHSITALEIYHGVLRNNATRARSFFYFRDPAFVSTVPASERADFTAESEESAHRLRSLKDEIRAVCKVENYPCIYAGQVGGRATLGGLEQFGNRVLEDLWQAITEEYQEESAPPSQLEVERSYHDAFIEGRIQRFIGREELLSSMNSYVDGDNPAPLVLIGDPGSGKSAVMARFARDSSSDGSSFVLAHFVGASPDSTDLRRLLLRLSNEISAHYGIETRIPDDFQELWQTFIRLLEQAGSRGRIVLLIDALNQLDDNHDPQGLHWLPALLPPGVRVIVSTLKGDFLDALRRKRPAPGELVIEALSVEERRALARSTLWEYRKRLDERPENDQMGGLLSKAQADNPLYLIIACEELRLFGEFERVTSRIKELPGDIEGLLEQVLARLETDFGANTVQEALSLLECSREGLLEIELLELLRSHGEEHLPRAVWARLYRGLRFYLRPTGEAGEGILNFFHGQLGKAVRKRYLNAETERRNHQKLAEFFKLKVDPSGDGDWRRDYLRGLAHLPYHLLKAGSTEDLFQLARDKSYGRTVEQSFPRDPQRALEALEMSIEAAAELDDPALMAEFILAYAERRGSTADESPLSACAAGETERAWELADLQPAERCVIWHLLLAWELLDENQPDQARATLTRLSQRDLPRLPHSSWHARCARSLLIYLVGIDQQLFRSISERLLEEDERSQLCARVTLRGYVTDARAIANGLPEGFRRADSLYQIAKAQVDLTSQRARSGDVDGAKGLVDEIEDQWCRVAALREVAGAEAAAGLHQSAREDFAAAIRGIPSKPELREGHRISGTDVLREIGVAQAKAGYGEDARHTFRAAADAAADHKDSYEAEASLSSVAISCANAGELDLALEFSASLSARRKGEALTAILNRQIEAGSLDAALAAAHAISDKEKNVSALNLVAVAQSRAEQLEAARLTFERAGRAARTMRDAREIAKSLTEIGLSQCHAGLHREAQTTFDEALRTIIDDYPQDPDAALISRLAEAQASAGLLDKAVQTAQIIDDDILRVTDRMRALAGIASVAAKSGQPAWARSLLDDMVEKVKRISMPGVDIFGGMAAAYVDLGDFSAASALIEIGRDRAWPVPDPIIYAVFGSHSPWRATDKQPMEDKGQARKIIADMLQTMSRAETREDAGRAVALSELVEIQTAAGDVDGALATARLLAEGDQRTRALKAVAGALAASSDPERAIELVSCEQGQREELLTAVAVNLARSRRYQRALEIAQTFDTWERDSTLLSIALEMAAHSEIELAIETAAQLEKRKDMWVFVKCAETQSSAGDLNGARESFQRAVNVALRSHLSDRLQDASFKNLNLWTVADKQASAGLTEDARQTLLQAREAGLIVIEEAKSRTDNERNTGAENLKRVGELLAKLGFIADALETVRLMQTRQTIWHRQVQHSKEGLVLQAVSAKQADEGEFASAYESASMIEPQDFRIDALRHLALAEARAGQLTIARQHLDEAVSVALLEIE